MKQQQESSGSVEHSKHTQEMLVALDKVLTCVEREGSRHKCRDELHILSKSLYNSLEANQQQQKRSFVNLLKSYFTEEK